MTAARTQCHRLDRTYGSLLDRSSPRELGPAPGVEKLLYPPTHPFVGFGRQRVGGKRLARKRSRPPPPQRSRERPTLRKIASSPPRSPGTPGSARAERARQPSLSCKSPPPQVIARQAWSSAAPTLPAVELRSPNIARPAPSEHRRHSVGHEN